MSLRRSSRQPIASAITASDKSPAQGKRAIIDGESQLGRTKRSKKSDTKAPNGDSYAGTFKVPPVPETPKKKRITKTTKPPPFTPTPSLVGLMRTNYNSGDTDEATPPQNRPVEPHVTNATLVTPGGTQSVAYSNSLPDSSPTKTGLPRPTATTGNILEQACAHLISVDPKMKPLIEKHPCSIFSPAGLAETIDPFRSLCTGIMGQQVSGPAAKSIKNKFIALFNESNPEAAAFPTPTQVTATDLARLRLAGLSGRKAEYIQGLAEKFASGELTTSMLMRASDEELFEKLIAVRGLGRWSVEMFACFALKRLDILSTGDLGVQRGMASFVGK